MKNGSPSQPNKGLAPGKSHRSLAGFLLIEMLVAISIILIITTIAINERDNFSRVTALNNVAHEVALTIRQAQSYGISSQGSNIGDDVYDFSYGVHFNTEATPQTFRLNRYSTDDDGSDPVLEDTISEYQLPEGIEFKEVCTFDVSLSDGNCDDEDDDFNGIIFLFRRPNPDAHFFTGIPTPITTANNLAVVLENDAGETRMIVANETGFIYVE